MAWVAVIVPVAISIMGGVAVMVWRFGGLTQAVQELGRRIARVERTLDSQEHRARQRGEWPTTPPSEQADRDED